MGPSALCELNPEVYSVYSFLMSDNVKLFAILDER